MAFQALKKMNSIAFLDENLLVENPCEGEKLTASQKLKIS